MREQGFVPCRHTSRKKGSEPRLFLACIPVRGLCGRGQSRIFRPAQATGSFADGWLPPFSSPFKTVPELAFREGVWDQIRIRESRFHEHAYLFVLASLEFHQTRLPERRHLDGRELSQAVRDLAIERYGVTARMVLEHWGVTTTEDIGNIVFTMVELGLLMSQPSDSRSDFDNVYSFDTAFEGSYPWNAPQLG